MEQRISIERMEQAVNLFGSFDENVRLIESEFKVTISNREGELRVNGEVEDTMLAVKALNALLTLSNRGEPITEQNVRYVISLVRAGQEDRISELTQDVICISSKGRPIKPKTIGQKKYIESVLKNTITIGVGPAGTGKTYLAVAAAVAAAVSAVGKLFGIRGWFYKVAGEKARSIDGPCDCTLPPYNEYVVLGPDDPDRVAAEINAVLGRPVLITDINDIGGVIMGGAPLSVDRGLMAAILRDNPLGQSHEQTPMGIIRPVA